MPPRKGRDVSLRTGDDIGRMLRLFHGRMRFFGVTWRRYGFGVIRWEPEQRTEGKS